MIIQKKYKPIGNCKGCNNCNFYPYFHYVETKEGGVELIYTKFDNDNSEVVNLATGEKHIYSVGVWNKVVEQIININRPIVTKENFEFGEKMMKEINKP